MRADLLQNGGLERRNMLSHDGAVAHAGGSSFATGWAVPSLKERPDAVAQRGRRRRS